MKVGIVQSDSCFRLVAVVFAVFSISFVSGGLAAQPVDIGLFQNDTTGGLQAESEWQWALRGGALRVLPLTAMTQEANELPLIIIDGANINRVVSREIADWVADGGALLIADAHSLLSESGKGKQGNETTVINDTLTKLAGVVPDYHDPGLIGSYPIITRRNPLLSPFREGDGLRLGRTGVGHALRLRPSDAVVLAETAQLRPGKGETVYRTSAPTFTVRRAGKGRVFFSSFSLATVAGCYPDEKGRATDCSAAGTARALMRFLIANLLWEEHGYQIPLLWETPGDVPTGVVITGDVHADGYNVQIRSARQMANVAKEIEVPLTFFVVGDVAGQARMHYDSLTRQGNVEIATHSAHGKKYRLGRSPVSGRRRGGVHGAGAVREDVHKAEDMLGLPGWPQERSWASAIRTEAWASNETESRAWTGMAEAGIALVFDHNADSILPQPQWSAPTAWFKGEIRQRLFVPIFEKSVTTANDDFMLPNGMARRIASLGSAEPDPARNHAVTFDLYGKYISRWHAAFRRIGLMGGVTEVWLWHPSTPARKGGFPELKRILREMRSDPGVQFFRGSELATWYRNREQFRVMPRYEEDERLVELELQVPQEDVLLPLPPDSAPAAATISYWVLGDISLPGWGTRQWTDEYGRTITVISRSMPLPKSQP